MSHFFLAPNKMSADASPRDMWMGPLRSQEAAGKSSYAEKLPQIHCTKLNLY
jgi:hypothetical protein